MPDIYSSEWSDSIKDLLNRNPEMEKSAPQGTYHMLLEVQGDASSPYLAEQAWRYYSIELVDGKCTLYIEADEEPPRKQFDFIFELPASLYEGIAAGTVDPIEGGLKGTIKIIGDMRILIQHAELVNVLKETYAREVETSWPLGKPPYAA